MAANCSSKTIANQILSPIRFTGRPLTMPSTCHRGGGIIGLHRNFFSHFSVVVKELYSLSLLDTRSPITSTTTVGRKKWTRRDLLAMRLTSSLFDTEITPLIFTTLAYSSTTFSLLIWSIDTKRFLEDLMVLHVDLFSCAHLPVIYLVFYIVVF